ncbi:MAG: transglycosylase SLT domain-containing protein [Candidatus Azobacteroides sp.]|nr:transglycosylase SLT domain-containing protein [Candidatus Azobacteroides sp.]
MDKSHSFDYKNGVIIVLTVVTTVLLTFFLIGSKDPGDVNERRNSVPNQTISVPVPSFVKFCDLNINLDRLDMRERFDREINVFTYFHSTTLMYIKKANRYFPIIEPILQKNGIPDDFKYLCVIESNLDTRALSPAKAAGLWQFMESTARDYGLEIRDEVDERYHIEKATEAACRYLNDSYYRYGDWVNVAASYNAGIAKISSEMVKQQVDNAFDLLLVSETSRYVFRLMAIKEIFQNPQKYGFILKRENLYPPVKVDYVDVTSGIFDFASFAKDYGINYMILKEYNVWLRDNKLMIPRDGRTYQIAIPRQSDLYYDKNHIQVHNKDWVID